jgi:glucosamine-6-phosphate deaminase
MNIIRTENPQQLGQSAGRKAAAIINEAIKEKGQAHVILATGTSQFETLNQLLKEQIDWSKVTVFHLDEYIDLAESHPASFRKYLKERFLNKIESVGAVYLINGENDPEEECARLRDVISLHPIDVALVGIGENGHLAFNDPPADFDTEEPYLVVNLDRACRLQQMNEGWFGSLEDVPQQAISMSIQQIMKSHHIICSIPDERKAQAVKNCLENEVSPLFPASILQEHPSCELYLDRASAYLLKTLASHNL